MLEYKEASIETLTNTELAILGLVAEQPKHGYQIEQDIAARGMRDWTEIGFSSIYYVLNKLEVGRMAGQRGSSRPERRRGSSRVGACQAAGSPAPGGCSAAARPRRGAAGRPAGCIT